MVGTSGGEWAMVVIDGEGGVSEAAVIRAGFKGGFIEVVDSFVMGLEGFFRQVGVPGEEVETG